MLGLLIGPDFDHVTNLVMCLGKLANQRHGFSVMSFYRVSWLSIIISFVATSVQSRCTLACAKLYVFIYSCVFMNYCFAVVHALTYVGALRSRGDSNQNLMKQ